MARAAQAAQHGLRSWASLPVDFADTILGRLPCHADRVRFGAVCRRWRCFARRNALPSWFPWIALPDRTFYSLPSSSFRRLPLHLHRHRQLPHAQSACGEWLVFQRQDGAYTLVSPFSTSTTMVLPKLPADPPVTHDLPTPIRKLIVCSPSLIVAVVAVTAGTSKLVVCRPGATSWSVCADEVMRGFQVQDMVFYQGELYALDLHNGNLISVSISEDGDTGGPSVSQVDLLIKNPSGDPAHSKHYLLKSGGVLLMVRRENPNETTLDSSDIEVMGVDFELNTRFKVFAVDLLRLRWRKLRSIGDDRVLFVGHWCSRSVHVPGHCMEYMGNRIFFMEDCGAHGYRSHQWETVQFHCSTYEMRTRRSQLFLEMPVQPVEAFPGTWLFPRAQVNGQW